MIDPSLRSRKPLSRSKRKPEVTVGKLGIVRLTGKAIGALRAQCFKRDGYACVECKQHGEFFNPLEMAHIKSRGAGGSDVLENVRTLCRQCHRAEHGNPPPRA